MEGPLQKGHIAKDFGKLGGGRVSFRSPAALGQDDEWQVGPTRLGGNPGSNRSEVISADGLFGQDADRDFLIE